VRVAVLSDVHGNLPALEAVLAEVAAEEVDAVVSGGDVVGGPFSAEVLDRLVSLPAIRFVRGNGERTMLEGTDEFGVDWDHERQRLGDDRVATIASWPLTTELELDGLGRTLFCHAVPSADEPIFTRITPDADVVALLGDVDADLLLCGHTHVQFDRRLPTGLRVVNAGSVGMPYEGRQGAFWALLDRDVELRRTHYDVEAAARAIRGVGGAPNEQQAGHLLAPPDPDEVSAFFESKRV
jgi:predicted phosphodiesterase